MELYVDIALFSIVSLLVIILLLCRTTINETSPLLIALRQLNKNYHFHNISPIYTYSITLQSKSKFDKYNVDTLFEETLRNNYQYWKTIQRKLQENRTLFNNYSNELCDLIKSIPETKQFPIPKIIWKFFEKPIFDCERLSPVINSEIICYVYYSSPKGRNNYSKSNSYSFSIIDAQYFNLQKRDYLEQTVKYKRQKERNKLSAKLRYKILERDHHRCQICGRSVSDGVKLHVDHIKPISKGGLTIESNLRTLCEDCNWGKSDEYEE